MNKVAENRPFKCQYCEKSFDRKDNLDSHVQSVHLKIQYVCETCLKGFHPSSLRRHQKTGACRRGKDKYTNTIFTMCKYEFGFELKTGF